MSKLYKKFKRLSAYLFHVRGDIETIAEGIGNNSPELKSKPISIEEIALEEALVDIEHHADALIRHVDYFLNRPQLSGKISGGTNAN